MPKARSRAQAGLFGAVAAGKSTKAKGLSRAEARTRLRGVKKSKLPARARPRSSRRRSSTKRKG